MPYSVEFKFFNTSEKINTCRTCRRLFESSLMTMALFMISTLIRNRLVVGDNVLSTTSYKEGFSNRDF